MGPDETQRSPDRQAAPIDPWCNDGSSREEPPWMRDKRIQKQKERLQEQKQRLTVRRSPTNTNNPFDDDSSQEIIFSLSTATSYSDSGSSHRNLTPGRSRRPISPIMEENKETESMGRGDGQSFRALPNPFPVYGSPRRSVNPFDSSVDGSMSSSVQLRRRIEQLELRQRPKIARPSASRPLKKNPKLLVYTDESVAGDSLDQFFDNTEETVVLNGNDRQIETTESSVSPSEMAVKAAETLRLSFSRGRNESIDTSSNARTPSQSRNIDQNGETTGSIPQPSYSIQSSTPKSAIGGHDASPALTPGESVRPASTRNRFPSPRQPQTPSEFPSFHAKVRAMSECGDQEEAIESRQEITPDVDLSLHDLIDEARTTDDIAWRNALYLLSVQPHLASQVEPECQMTSLHMCCMAIDVEQPPPIWMVRCLIYTNPLQCQMEDSGGRLPLHLLAATTADVALMQLLVEEFPASVAHTDSRGFSPLHLLLKNDQIPLTLEHLRILLGQTVKPVEEKKTPMQFRKGEHLKASFQDLEELQIKQQEKHEQVFDVYPTDVQQTLRKITQWKRRQVRVSNGLHPQHQLALVFHNPAAIATPSSRQLPLHLMARRKLPNNVNSALSAYKLANRDALIRVLIAAYPEALVSTDVNGRTPLLTALLQAEALPDTAMVDLLLGKHTPGFASTPTRSPAQLAASDTLQLPLHVAAEEMANNFELLSTIAEAYPRAVQVQDARGRTPIHCALQNYRSAQLDEATFGILLMSHNRNYEHVARTMDHDGKRPLDLVIENPRALQRWKGEEGDDIMCAFMDASIDTPKNARQSSELLDRIRRLPPWLRRSACASSHVQRTLLEQLACPTNTALVMLQGCSLVTLLIFLRIALEGDGIEFRSWIPINYLCAYNLITQLMFWGTASYLGEFYSLVFSNGWRWIDLLAVCCSIAVAFVLQTDITTLRASLNTELADFSKYIPAEDHQVVSTLGAWATGLLWASLIGYLAQWWCGMAVFVGSTYQIIRTLFWPFTVAAIGVVAMSQILVTLEDCVDGSICSLADAYTTIYWIILGEPIIGVGEFSAFENPMSTSMIVLLMFYTLLWLFWLVSIVAMMVSEAHRLDRHQIALQWFWVPKVTLTVSSRLPFKEATKDRTTCMERYCDFLERLWHVLLSSIRGGHLKGEVYWDSWCFRPGFIHLTRLMAFIIMPIWFCLGVATLGFLWPPQLRRWLFSTQIQNFGKKPQGTLQERLSVVKLSHLKGEIETFQSKSIDQNHAMQEDLAQIKELLFRAMAE